MDGKATTQEVKGVVEVTHVPGLEGTEEPVVVRSAEFDSLEPASPAEAPTKKLNLLYDLHLTVSVQLGRTQMMVKDILNLGRGSIIELEKLAGDPVDLYINDKKMAEGEVVIVDDHFGVRITNIVNDSERLKTFE